MFKCNNLVGQISGCVLIVFFIFVLPCKSSNCVHDGLVTSKRSLVTRSLKYQDIRADRDKSPNLFEPLAIHFYLDSVQHILPPNAMYNIDMAIRKIKKYIQDTFQVRKRKRPFLLERLSCTQKWRYGMNKGKCSEFVKEHELCSSVEIYHTIPDRFLDKLDIYDFDYPEPRSSLKAGAGLWDSNFIVFIISQDTKLCEQKDVAAYGQYCRKKRDTNEPLAGIINICPNYFSLKIYPFQHYYNVILHELFHVMGFSLNFFEKYLPCEKGIYCDLPKQIIQEDNSTVARLMFPLVIESTQIHFKCSKPDFGGPMAKKEEKQSSLIEYFTSHWHPVLMYSSIMTPSFTEYDQLVVDNITLAVFESTGWYRVKFDNADNFQFGKGEGCDFGLGDDSCENSIYLCDPSNNATGCDLLHKTIGRCKNLTDSHPCGVYQPYSELDCESESQDHYGSDFYFLSFDQKCFMLENQESQYQPSCLPIKCKSENTYDVYINMTWNECNSTRRTPMQNSFISCPDGQLFCQESQRNLTRHVCTAENLFVSIRMYFSQPSFDELDAFDHFKNFKVTALNGIAEKIGIPVNYIVNASLSVFKQIYLDFAICPPDGVDFNEIVLNTQKFLDNGSFFHTLRGSVSEIIISSSDIKTDPVEMINFSDHEGFRTLIVFPVICAIFLIVTFVASIVRLFLFQKHKPTRDKESRPSTNQMSEIS